MRKKVLIVDDSAIVRRSLADVISQDEDLEVMGTASDPYFAAEKIKKQIPDVITLDIEMPRMDGITFLRTIMSQRPIPIVVISSLTRKGTETALQALQYGAVEILAKPKMYGLDHEIEENRIRILNAIKAAANVRVGKKKLALNAISSSKNSNGRLSADVVLDRIKGTSSMLKTTEKIVVIGASTGGTEALRSILRSLPYDAPATAIVQHMPEHFTRSFADSLNMQCKVTVKEAQDGDSLTRGTVLIAPGNKHMMIRRSGARYFVHIKDGPLVNRHRPSVDVLFRSAANFAGANCKGIILTGMGDDGAAGLQEMREAGAFTIAQDEKTCVVFGMPKAAIARGCVTKILALQDIPKYIS
jgi:two-component system chemotaxis response regulator CheB